MGATNLDKQYGTARQLNTRIGIYQHQQGDSTFHEWMAGHVREYRGASVLELGCGTGILWNHLFSRFHDCSITLTDRSPGMLETARTNLDSTKYRFGEVDFHSIPFEDSQFDVVISNHNLYHAQDIHVVLGEISRVLKDDGLFMCSTNSARHLHELRDLLRRFEGGVDWPVSWHVRKFGMETGPEILEHHFARCSSHLFSTHLEVPSVEPIIDYLHSGQDPRVDAYLERHRDSIAESLRDEIARRGYVHITTESGMFLCRGPRTRE